MKSYKLLVPVILVVAMLGSIYMLYDARSQVQAEYDEAVKAARQYVKDGIDKYAIENYETALDIKPSEDLYYEFAAYYYNKQDYKHAMSVCSDIMEEYPKYAKGYELAMDMDLERKSYSSCFELYEVYKKRSDHSDKIEKIMEDIKYTYYLKSTFSNVGVYCGGYCVMQQEDMWGYVNTSGNVEIDAKYVYAGPMADGYAAVIDQDGYAYFIDESGEKVKYIKALPSANALGILSGDVCTAYDGKEWAIYNVEKGKISDGYDYASSINLDTIAVEKDGKWSIVDPEGKELSSEKYDEIYVDEKDIAYRNERLFVKQDGSYYMIDNSGSKITDEAFEDAVLFADATYAAVKKNGKWGFIDSEGKWVIEPAYDNARSFSNGFAAVEKDGKWGFIDSDNKLCIDYTFDDAKDFTDAGSVYVKDGEDWSLLKLYSYDN